MEYVCGDYLVTCIERAFFLSLHMSIPTIGFPAWSDIIQPVHRSRLGAWNFGFKMRDSINCVEK